MDETLARMLNGLKTREPVFYGPLRVEELDEAGSVPELRVVSEGTLPVLILEGDELIGAKQDRVVNSSVLVAADSTLVLPASCVERGRWSYRSRSFSSVAGGPHLSSKPSHRISCARCDPSQGRRGSTDPRGRGKTSEQEPESDGAPDLAGGIPLV